MADELAQTRSRLTENDVYKTFGAVCAHRGDSYQRNHNVSKTLFDYALKRIHGSVQGSETKPYKVAIHLDDDLANVITAQCSCPRQTHCKHCAAALLDALRRGKLDSAYALKSMLAEKQSSQNEEPTEPAFFTRDRDLVPSVIKQETPSTKEPPKPSPLVLNWLRTLSSELEEQPQVPEVGSSKIDTVLYVLSATPDGKPMLNIFHARRLKTGGWGTMQSTTLEVLANQGAKYVTQLDHEIGKLMLAGSKESVWHYRTSTFPDSAIVCRLLIERLLASNRFYWQKVDGTPLGPGPSKQGTLHWQSLPDGKQRLQFSSGIKEETTLTAGCGWYVDPKANLLGELLLPISQQAFKTIVSAPAVEPFEAEAVSLALDKLHGVPKPKCNLNIETINPTFTPCLRLAVKRGDIKTEVLPSFRDPDPYERLTVAELTFAYDGVQFATQDQEEKRVIEGDVLSIYKRDTAKETLCMKELEKHGLRRLIRRYSHEERAFTFNNFNDEIDWLEFCHNAVPQLKSMGWKVSFDSSFLFRFVEADREWSAEATEGADYWFSLDLGITVNGKRIPLLPILSSALKRIRGSNPLRELEHLNRNGSFYALLPDGRYTALPFARVKSIIEVLIELFDKEQHATKDKVDLTFPQMIEFANLATAAAGKAGSWVLGHRLQNVIDRLKNSQDLQQKIIPPDTFNTELRPYQSDGLTWLNFLREFKLGGILADDMGLGKTIQTLAHIAFEKSENRLTKPFLVICPTSVLPNWMSEIERFTPSLTVTALFGSSRAESYSNISKSDIVLTTYPLVVKDIEKLTTHRRWQAIVLDEAQTIKNPTTQITQSVARLKGEYRICLTGTPVENHLGELWSQFNFLMPGFLKDLPSFTRTFKTPIEKQRNVFKRDVLAKRIRPFLLRRTKELVASELPAKIEIIKRVDLDEAQRDLYETVRLAMFTRVKEVLSSKGLAKSQIIILDALLKLRQVCCDPRLVSTAKAKEVQSSAKRELLLDMLEELVEEGKKILLFSQFTSMLDLIAPELKARNIDFTEIRGDTKDRKTPVDLFQSGKVPVFLLSLKAGGTGLNLTAADTVIHYDPWWNPAVETQATDRAHRIGQTKSVFVFKLIAAGTIEERMLQLQERKKAIAQGIYDSDNTLPLNLTAEDIESLFEPLD